MSRVDTIQASLQQGLRLEKLEIINESSMHHVPKGSESHFKLMIVSMDFEGLSRVKRHQKVQAILKAEFETGLHALSLHLFTPQEWDATKEVPSSPKCRGGNNQ